MRRVPEKRRGGREVKSFATDVVLVLGVVCIVTGLAFALGLIPKPTPPKPLPSRPVSVARSYLTTTVVCEDGSVWVNHGMANEWYPLSEAGK